MQTLPKLARKRPYRRSLLPSAPPSTTPFGGHGALVEIETASGCVDGPLDDWSLEALTFRVEASGCAPVGSAAQVIVRSRRGATRVLGATVGARHGETQRLVLDPLDEDAARDLLRVARVDSEPHRDTRPAPAEVREPVSEPERIRALFHNLVAERRVGRIHPLDGEPIEVTAVAFETEGGDHVRFRMSRGALPRPPYFIELEGYSSVYWIPVLEAVCDPEARSLEVWMPAAVVRVRHRKNPRASAPETHRVRFRHPVFGRTIERPVRDVARQGLSFVTVLEEDLLHEGLALEVTLIGEGLGEDEAVSLRGEIRSVTALRGGRHACGLSIEPVDDDAQQRWTQLVGTILHPNTELARDFGEALWSLYVDSGYLSLSDATPASFDSLRAPFIAGVKKLAEAPELGGHVVWKSQERICASAAILRPYAGSWLGFQMAKIPGERIDGVPRRRILRDLLLHAFEHIGHDAKPGWFAAHYQVDATIGRLTQHRFAQRHVPTGEACILRFRAVELESDGAPLASDGYEVGPAREGEVRALLEGIAEQRPAAYVDALDFDEARFDLRAIQQAWARVGLRRERAVLVARRHGVLRAAAVVEAAEPGLHLFGLLDVVRIFALGPGGDGATQSLLEGARAWYRERGHERFVWLAEAEQSERPVPESLRDLGLADMTLVSGRLLPDLLEHIDEVTAPRRV
ncbi:MAG: hypothetical protein RLO52_18695 [Sandaracinaceae bacterium]